MNGVIIPSRLFRGSAGQPFITAVNRCFSQDITHEDIKNVVPVLSEGKFPSPSAQAVKRGTGGRSSFNGTVVTVFGPGFLARSVVNKLAKIGSQVIIPYRRDPYSVRDFKLSGDLGQILFLPIYLRDEDSIRKAMKYSNVVINLIGKSNETASFTFDEVHVEGARRIARIARETGVQRLIHVSALGCTPEPKPVILRNGSQFLKSKYYGELAVREEFPDAIIFRPSDIYGMGDKHFLYWASWERRSYKKVLLWKNGRGVYKMPVYRSDVAQGIVNAVFDNVSPGKTYDAVGPRKYELYELIRFYNRCVQRDELHGWKEVRDLRWQPTFLIRVAINDMVRKSPNISWEKLEKEYIDDATTPGNPTLEDLGVQLSYVEDKAPFFLKFFSRFGFYEPDYGEEPPPAPPKFVAA